MPASLIGSLLFPEKKPVVPSAPHVDIDSATTGAIGAAKSNLPSLEQLASSINEFSSDELLKNLNKVLPGYSEIMGKEKGKIDDFLSGKLPKDVSDLIGQRAAEMGIARGTAGGSVDSETELRNLGLTSLDMIKTGFDSASRWMSQAAKPAQFDFTQFMLTPQQRIQDQQWNESMRWGPEWLQNQLKAQLPEWQEALKQEMGSMENSLFSMGGMAAGGMGGGGGGL